MEGKGGEWSIESYREEGRKRGYRKVWTGVDRGYKEVWRGREEEGL